MGELSIISANAGTMPVISELFIEYSKSLDVDLCFQNFSEELAGLPGSYAPPRGTLLLAYIENAVAGCVAVRPFQEDVAELKRLYLRPGFRGTGAGRALTLAALDFAAKAGYRRIVLDSLPSMQKAIALYGTLGFVRIPPYREYTVPGVTFMEKELQWTTSASSQT
jgi:ribosomal protein S18 acetylase RimI-like enzyme